MGTSTEPSTKAARSTNTRRWSRSCSTGTHRDGPLSSTDIESRPAIDWYWGPTTPFARYSRPSPTRSSGLSRREGNRRIYDLVERLFPADLLAERHPEDEQRRHKLLSRFRAHGLLGNAGEAVVWLGIAPAADRTRLRNDLVASGAIAPVGVEGVRGTRYVVASDLDDLAAAEREVEAGQPPGEATPGVAFLAPLDPLVWDRDLLRQLWGFDYVWEVYVPAKKRRWGYYVLPMLFGDRLVGRIEPRLDRATGTLRILGIWWEDDFDPLADPAFWSAFGEAIGRIVTSVGCGGSPGPGPSGIGRSWRPFATAWRRSSTPEPGPPVHCPPVCGTIP